MLGLKFVKSNFSVELDQNFCFSSNVGALI